MKKITSLFVALSVLLGSWPAYAGYAQLRPPQGWSQGMGAAVPGTSGLFNFGQAANGSVFKGSTVLTNSSLSVAGQVVNVPVAMRVAANAATVAATFYGANPLVLGVLGVAWLAESCITYSGGSFQLTCGGSTPPQSDGYSYFVNGYAGFPTRSQACAALSDGTVVGWVDGNSCWTGSAPGVKRFGPFTLNRYASSACPAGWYITPGGCVQTPPPQVITPAQVVEKMAPKPIPIGLPAEIPIPLPVQPPVFNPDPAYDPASPLSPRPLWVPTGDPVKNPNPSNNPDGSPGPNPTPDTWTQPGVRVQPSPTPSDPWRVDVTPDPKTKNDPSPNDSPETVTPPRPEPLDILTCGLPGKPRCLIDETGTKPDAGTTLDPAKTALDTVKTDAKTAIDSAQTIAAPAWTFSFQLPTGCAPYQTGLRGVLLNICQYQSTIHDLMSMIWAGATFFCLVGMVGRTIRES